MTGLSLLCSYPKSGNTWLRAVLGAVIAGESHIQLQQGLPFKILPLRHHFDDLMGIDSSELTIAEIDAVRAAYCRAVASAHDLPRIWKVHDCFYPPSGTEPQFPADALAAVIYIVRDPRDIAVSFAHHMNKSIDESIAVMADKNRRITLTRFMLDAQLPQYLSSWSRHVESWLDAPGINLHLMRYEDMIGNPEQSFSAAIRFLGIEYPSSGLQRALTACRFETLCAREEQEGFCERPRVMEKFFRRGIAGGWRDSLISEQIKRIEADHGSMMCRLGYLP